MLDGSDIHTFHALRLLTDSVATDSKPLVLWVGAGASAWCGYPLWGHLAEAVHSQFLRHEPDYDKEAAVELIESGRYPEFFQLCKGLNKQSYYSLLADSLKSKDPTPVYKRFIEALSLLKPLHIVTTNVDELLENNLNAITTIQRSDLERCIGLLQSKRPFVCKLHGSISAVQSIVFTTNEYANLLGDQKYLELIKYIFTAATVVFIGYGLADKYVLDLLSSSAELRNIFGGGPHFAVVPPNISVPETIKPIRYIPEPNKDHRSAIQTVEELRISRNISTRENPSAYDTLKANKIISAHLISHIFPPGTHHSVQMLQVEGGAKMVMGHGLTNAEIPSTFSTAMHDLIVGLLCFDTVYANLMSLPEVHKLVGAQTLVRLVVSNSLKFVLMPTQDIILYREYGEQNGMLNSIYYPGKSGSDLFDQQIRRMVKPVSGVETEIFKDYYELIKCATVFYSREAEPDIRGLVGGLLLRPSIRRLIGMSGGTSLMSLPEWMIFPVLRLAYVVRMGVTCQLLGIASTKLEYGESGLAGPAFAASAGAEWADGMASYVLTGRFNCDLGMYSLRDLNVLSAILNFRDSQSGTALRKEILEQLSLRLGSDFVASVNAGLRAAIPTRILQEAHDQLAGLLIAEGAVSAAMTPALWNNAEYAETALLLWRKQSALTLKSYCEKRSIRLSDRCPCGSGERLRFCCAESLG